MSFGAKVLSNQGYHLYFDNFYTNTKLLKDLFVVGMYACGTIFRNCDGYPQKLKDIKQFNKTAARGGMRWARMSDILCVQWKDNRSISILSTIHMANEETTNTENKSQWEICKIISLTDLQ